MSKVKSSLAGVFKFLLSPELRPSEVRLGRAALVAVGAYLGVKGYQVS